MRTSLSLLALIFTMTVLAPTQSLQADIVRNLQMQNQIDDVVSLPDLLDLLEKMKDDDDLSYAVWHNALTKLEDHFRFFWNRIAQDKDKESLRSRIDWMEKGITAVD